MLFVQAYKVQSEQLEQCLESVPLMYQAVQKVTLLFLLQADLFLVD